jgi:hypothetical protein
LKGKRHYEQQRFMLALKLAGFERMENSPIALRRAACRLPRERLSPMPT